MYVLGTGTVWQISIATKTASCLPNVPANFDPSPFLARVDPKLYFGVAGTLFTANDHGFYSIANSTVTLDTTPQSTPVSLSALGGLLYYYDSGLAPGDNNGGGVGTYLPATDVWNVLPGTSDSEGFNYYTTLTPPNGVAATPNGAWFSASAPYACGNVVSYWDGDCLGQVIYLDNWGVVPSLNFSVPLGTNQNVGVVANPQSYTISSRRRAPLNAHGGPFSAKTAQVSICTVTALTPFTFQITPLKAGACPITISDATTGRTQQVNVTITAAAATSSTRRSGQAPLRHVRGAPAVRPH
jgi:hypothetical protein